MIHWSLISTIQWFWKFAFWNSTRMHVNLETQWHYMHSRNEQFTVSTHDHFIQNPSNHKALKIINKINSTSTGLTQDLGPICFRLSGPRFSEKVRFWDKPTVWRIGCVNKLGIWQSWLFWVDCVSRVVKCLKWPEADAISFFYWILAEVNNSNVF